MPETQHYLYRIQPTRLEMLSEGPSAQEAEIITKHFDYLSDLALRGVVILAGRTLNVDEDSFGIVIFRAKTEESAREVMNNDPAVQHGVMHAKLYPYRIAVIAENPID